MGMNRQFRTTASWDQAIEMLDGVFPLVRGSHATVRTYLVYFDHLLAIQADGTSTGLANPSQFREAGGCEECPQSVLLQNGSLMVEIEPASQRVGGTALPIGQHRLQLLTEIRVQDNARAA